MRSSNVTRKTGETSIKLTLELDGQGNRDIQTGVGFLDHMLELFTRHGLFDLAVQATGDVEVDDHHTVEDVGICLGQALDEALGDKAGICRFGAAAIPMEDALAQIALDLGGRSFLVYQADYPTPKTGDFDVVLVQEFMLALSRSGKLNLHIQVPYGSNTHHMAEAVFKGTARALREAVAIDPRQKGVPSTKGVL